MPDTSLTQLTTWFDQYSQPYRDSDHSELAKTSALKYKHTLHVVAEMKGLVASLNLNENESEIAQIIALFHDVGRFEQFKRYNTLADRLSVDHSELGVEVLREHDVLSEFDAATVELIENAILAHNKLAIPTHYEGEQLFYAKLIRDADKLDILRVFVEVDSNNDLEMLKKAYIELDESDTVNPELLQFFERKELVRIEHLRSRHDMRLLILSWVFDLNYPHSVQRFRDRGDAAYLMNRLPDVPVVDAIRQIVQDVLSGPDQSQTNRVA
jgi:putative nucleotidyltransferase with HDIG domain